MFVYKVSGCGSESWCSHCKQLFLFNFLTNISNKMEDQTIEKKERKGEKSY